MAKATSAARAVPRAPAPKAPARRLPPEEREAQILHKAIEYFSAHGFSGSTRELARQIGIAQPLLYRYFPTKQALIDRVYQEVYLSRWNPDWEDWLADRGSPLKARMTRYYQDYARFILRREWIRIFIFAGLTQAGINNRYLTHLRERIFRLILREVRHEYGLGEPADEAGQEAEIELVWSIHAAIFYVGMRKWVYGLPIPKDLDRLVEHKVTAFLEGAPAVMAGLRNGPGEPAGRGRRTTGRGALAADRSII